MRKILLFLIPLLALLFALAQAFPQALRRQDNAMQMVYLLVLLCAIGAGLARRRMELPKTAAHAAIWLAIFAALLAAYAYRDAFLSSRLAAELLPSRPHAVGRAMQFRAAEDGQFHIAAAVNGAPVDFLLDTGATDIVLSREDAARAGLAPQTLAYTRAYSTANGGVYGAPVTLDDVRIGALHLSGVPASVNGGAMQGSLLGMRFLRALASVRIEGDVLTLTPRN